MLYNICLKGEKEKNSMTGSRLSEKISIVHAQISVICTILLYEITVYYTSVVFALNILQLSCLYYFSDMRDYSGGDHPHGQYFNNQDTLQLASTAQCSETNDASPSYTISSK